MDGESFHFKVEHELFKPLVIEAHDIGGGDRQLYLTHYNQENGDAWIDAELVMKLEATGSLHFVETASCDPFTGGESRLPDAAFGELFASNLVTQGFGAAAAKAQAAHREAESQAARRAAAQSDESALEKTEALPSAPTLDHSLELSHEGPGSVQDLVVQADDIGCKPIYDESSTDFGHQGGQEVSSLGQPSGGHPDRLTSTLQDLRVWYREARALGRSPDHLKKIESVGTTVAAGDLTAFGPRDKQMRQVDQDQFQQQVSNVAVQARFLLARLGSPAQEGATRFQGKTYGLLTKDDRLTVTAEGRGIILDVHGDEVRLSKVEKGDANRFTKFVQTVQQDLPALQTISARRPTGYER